MTLQSSSRVSIHGDKGIFRLSELFGFGSKFSMVLRDLKCHHGILVRVEIYRDVDINNHVLNLTAVHRMCNGYRYN